ncbi:MAG: hypothetical protein AAF191_21115 [Verrucomicrobiota bacterium]
MSFFLDFDLETLIVGEPPESKAIVEFLFSGEALHQVEELFRQPGIGTLLAQDVLDRAARETIVSELLDSRI